MAQHRVTSDHAEEVRDLFNAKAPGWGLKYSGKAPLVWRVDTFSRAVAARVQPPAKLLDFGCGTGEIPRALATRGYRMTGCDIAEDMIAGCKAAGGDVEWVLLPPDWSTLPFPDGAFGGVVSSSVLEYVPDVHAVFREWARILAPGGTLVVSVPNRDHVVRRVERALSAVARTPIGNVVSGRGGRLASYAAYLRLSRNRLRVSEWGDVASTYGFSLEAAEARGTMRVLSFATKPAPK